MNILILCDRYPSSMLDGLTLRIIHYVRKLRVRHNFDLVCYGPADETPFVPPLFGHVEVFAAPPATAQTGWAKLHDAFSVDALYYFSAEVKQHLEKIIASRNYDAIWDAGSNMLLNLPASASEIPLLADTVDDCVLTRWRILRESKGLTSRLKGLKELLLQAMFTRKYIAAANANLLVSEIDAAVYSRVCPGKRVEVIHNGVDADFFKPLGAEVEPHELIFEGSISFAPNRDGILYFVDEILPLIRQSIPDVKFTIAGRNPPPEIQRLASDSITVTGFVDDVRPYLDRAAVFVCPLRGGAGIKNKVLQAWSMGKAVVATTPSIGGLKVQDGKNIFVRDAPESFAAEVIRLLQNPAEAAQIGQNARATIMDHYTWDKKAAQLEALLVSISNEGRHR